MAVSSNNKTVQTFPAYLSGFSNPPTNAYNRMVPATQLRLFCNKPQQTMAMIQGHGPASLALSDTEYTSHETLAFPTTNAHQNNGAQAAIGHDITSFDDLFRYQDEQSGDGEAGAAQQWREGRPQSQYHMSFRAADFTTGIFTSDTSSGSFSSSFGRSDLFDDLDIPRKVDSSPMLPAPALLPHQVDTSKYENVEDEDWRMSSLDYEAGSPSSVAASSNGPLTPTTPDGSEFFTRSLSVDNFYGMGDVLLGPDVKVNAGDPDVFPRPVVNVSQPSFSSGCHCPTCRGAFTQNATLAQIFNAAQPALPPFTTHADQHAFNTLGHSAFFSNVQPVATVAPAPAPLPANAQELNSMLVTDRSAMDTTPEGSDSGEGEGSDDNASDGDGDVNDQAVAEAARRRARDRYLLEMRDNGLSYKEIKRRGGFSEAESTLRGRVRVLTKDKSQRVRKPEWTANDIRLLNHAVDRYSAADPLDDLSVRESHGRIPWKKISSWMKDHGSSYTFAAATCAKKWRQIN